MLKKMTDQIFIPFRSLQKTEKQMVLKILRCVAAVIRQTKRSSFIRRVNQSLLFSLMAIWYGLCSSSIKLQAELWSSSWKWRLNLKSCVLQQLKMSRVQIHISNVALVFVLCGLWNFVGLCFSHTVLHHPKESNIRVVKCDTLLPAQN